MPDPKVERRDEMTAQGVRGLFLINGGGAVALLAFLQVIWKEVTALVPFVVWGLVPMVLGVAAAACIQFIRVESSLHWEATSGRGKTLAKVHRRLSLFSIICFLAGMFVIIAGALSNLPDVAT